MSNFVLVLFFVALQVFFLSIYFEMAKHSFGILIKEDSLKKSFLGKYEYKARMSGLIANGCLMLSIILLLLIGISVYLNWL